MLLELSNTQMFFAVWFPSVATLAVFCFAMGLKDAIVRRWRESRRSPSTCHLLPARDLRARRERRTGRRSGEGVNR